MTTFQVETFEGILPEARELFPLHWKELANDQDKIALACDEERYIRIEKEGGLHVVTVRADGKLVGYFFATILPHLHYKDAGPMAYTDVYFILPEFRKGGAGVRLIRTVERTLRLRGAKKFYLSTKIKQDHSQLFLMMGFTASDIVFTKLL